MSSSASSKRKSSRWNRRRKETEPASTKNEYIPPGLQDAPAPSDFVTSPPEQRGLTTGISTLFRTRASSREPKDSRKPDKSSADTEDTPPSPGNRDQSTMARTLAAIDAQVPGASAAATIGGTPRNPSRIFTNDDSDDSYESRLSSASLGEDKSATSVASAASGTMRTLIRFRGFSTSIQSLFLDESLVCASMGCFGLLLSQRTEFLLDARNRQRGLTKRSGNKSAYRHPSRLLAYALFGTILLMVVTFFIWGFGTSSGLQEVFEEDYDILEDDGRVYYQPNDDDGRFVNNDDVGNVYYNDDGKMAYNDDRAAENNDAYDDGDYSHNDDDNDDDGNDDNIDDDQNNDDGNNRRRSLHLNCRNGKCNEDKTTVSTDILDMDDDDKFHPRRVYRFLEPICSTRRYKENLWDPALNFIHLEWYQDGRLLEETPSSVSTSTAWDTATTTRVIIGALFILLLGFVGRRRRMRTRYAIVKARAQEDHLYYASGASMKVDSNEDNYEGACAHTLLGCYPIDTDPFGEADEKEENDEMEEEPPEKKRKHQDCVARFFGVLSATFCGTICKCWFQFFSICALAQEAREMRLLLPQKFQRIDYITHQPFSEYQTSVINLRRGWMGKTRKKTGFLPHIQALSRLSRYILIMFATTVAAIVISLLFNPRTSFSIADVIVCAGTFLQSFLVLYVVHWIFHKSDLSLDAVVKLFTAGFVVGVPSAVFFEAILMNLILAVGYSLYGILESQFGVDFEMWIAQNYVALWILSALIDAYMVAAVTEELCKYYTFRAVEHPDLVFLTGLNNQVDFEQAFEGGFANYAFGSHQVSNLNRTSSFNSVRSHRSNASTASLAILRSGASEDYVEDEPDVRTLRQQAAAVTTGMISVAVGLACAENFMYVFLLGGAGGGDSGVLEEWVVLFFRSIFPVHALAGAMQSINMIRKFVECTSDGNDHRIGVGRIVLPAILLHGSFDAILYGINIYIETAWDAYKEENNGNVEADANPYNPVVVNLVAWMSIIVIMLGGILWFYRENRQQKQRLKVMEEQNKMGTPPGRPSLSEMELV